MTTSLHSITVLELHRLTPQQLRLWEELGGVGWTPVRQGIEAGTGGFEMEGGTRQYSVQNYHVTGKKRKR
jgi:hypothetical protein